MHLKLEGWKKRKYGKCNNNNYSGININFRKMQKQWHLIFNINNYSPDFYLHVMDICLYLPQKPCQLTLQYILCMYILHSSMFILWLFLWPPSFLSPFMGFSFITFWTHHVDCIFLYIFTVSHLIFSVCSVCINCYLS